MNAARETLPGSPRRGVTDPTRAIPAHVPKRNFGIASLAAHAARRGCLRRCRSEAEGILFFPGVRTRNVSVSSRRSAADAVRGDISMAVASAFGRRRRAKAKAGKAGQLAGRKNPTL